MKAYLAFLFIKCDHGWMHHYWEFTLCNQTKKSSTKYEYRREDAEIKYNEKIIKLADKAKFDF
jgi:hypothetical protein